MTTTESYSSSVLSDSLAEVERKTVGLSLRSLSVLLRFLVDAVCLPCSLFGMRCDFHVFHHASPTAKWRIRGRQEATLRSTRIIKDVYHSSEECRFCTEGKALARVSKLTFRT